MVQVARRSLAPSPRGAAASCRASSPAARSASPRRAGSGPAVSIGRAWRPDDFDVQLFPKWRSSGTSSAPPATLVMRDIPAQGRGLGVHQVSTSARDDETRSPGQPDHPDPALDDDRRRYAETGPAHWQVFYDTLDRSRHGPIPAPPQQAAVETALIKNVVGRRHGDSGSVPPALATMQRDLETGPGGGPDDHRRTAAPTADDARRAPAGSTAPDPPRAERARARC